MIRQICIPLFIAVFLLACQGSRHFAKLGTKQEIAGLTTEAANSYYTALLKNRSNIDAQVGMKKTGQLVLNNLLNDFARSKNFGTPREAVYQFHTARDYRDRIKGVGIDLLLADFYLADYDAVKSTYLLQLYDEGTTLLEEQKFSEAEALFSEIKRLDPNYKDSGELADMAYLEPLYRKGIEEMDHQRYRAAYENFQRVIERKDQYKNTRDMSKQCIEKGRFTIALLPFENGTSTLGLDVKISAYALDALTSVNDPFLRVVDRDHMQAILQEQKLQLSGVVDDATAVKVGELVGANAILTGTVLSYSATTGTLRSKTRDAFESYSFKKLNPVDGKYYYETRYRPTNYTEYYNSASSSVSFQYKLITLETGEIIKTEIIEKTVNDEVLYGKYTGEVNNLFPMVQGVVSNNPQDRRQLTNLFSARQQLRPAGELSNDLFNTVSTQMSKQIGIQIKQIVQ